MIRTLSAEILKYRRTPTLLLAVGIPLLIALAGWLFLLLAKMPLAKQPEALSGLMMALWGAMALPMGVAILAGQAVGMEDHHLKQVLVQPVGRLTIYVAKFMAVLGLVLLGSLALILGFGVVAALRGLFTLALLGKFAGGVGLLFLGALPVVMLSVALSFRFKWGVTVGSAMVGSTVMGFAMNHPVAWKFLPWSYPVALAGESSSIAAAVQPLIALTFVTFAGLGYLAFLRQEPR